MQAFAELVHRLYFTAGNSAKARILKHYFQSSVDPDRGWAVAALSGTLDLSLFKRKLVLQLIKSRVDPYLFDASYDYVGDLSETVSLLWPTEQGSQAQAALPSLSELIEKLGASSQKQTQTYLAGLLDQMTPIQRWALLKLGTGGLRIGMSARSVKKTLADFGGVDLQEIEQLWHAIEPPYTELFQWLENKTPKPDITGKVAFMPLMLAHPIDDATKTLLNPEDWLAEWKYDGIRVQLVTTPKGAAIFSRTGENISKSFPELDRQISGEAVIDGELVVMRGKVLGSFNDLQKRLNKKNPTKKDILNYPSAVIAYDLLSINSQPLIEMSLMERRARLAELIQHGKILEPLSLSPAIPFGGLHELEHMVEKLSADKGSHVEGLMIKRKSGRYFSGRPKGEWFKWKKQPELIDAVLMYAQRGHGKRSSFYSDYTFGLWEQGNLLPIGKAYFGFTDEELTRLDKWVRTHTNQRFGPVRGVEVGLVFEIAFDSVHASARHKSGVALRFPRIHRIRWDKPASEADQLATLKERIAP